MPNGLVPGSGDPLFVNPGYDDSCAAIAELPDGTLLASYYLRLSSGG